MYGVLFKDNSEAAFANLKVWHSVGLIMAFGYQSHLCLPIKVYILLGSLVVAMVGYMTVEVTEWRQRRKVDDDTSIKSL